MFESRAGALGRLPVRVEVVERNGDARVDGAHRGVDAPVELAQAPMELRAGLLGLLLSLAEPPEDLVHAIELGLHGLEHAAAELKSILKLFLGARRAGVHLPAALDQPLQLAARRRGVIDEGLELVGLLAHCILIEHAQVEDRLLVYVV